MRILTVFPCILLIFLFLSVVIACLYFYLYIRDQQKFMQFWGLAWLSFAIGLVIVFFYLTFPSELLLELRRLMDMLNSVLLLVGVFSFSHQKMPGYWLRFTLYLLILSGVCILCRMGLSSFYLPVCLYQLCIGAVIGYRILRYWSLPGMEKTIALVTFLAWCLGNPVISIYELYAGVSSTVLSTELLLANLLNIVILILASYTMNTQRALGGGLYKDVVKHARDVIFYYVVRPYAHFRFLSPSVLTITGFSPSAFYSDPGLLASLAQDQHVDAVMDMIDGSIAYPEGQVFRFEKKDGSSFWGELSTRIICGNDGKPDAVEGVLRDITEMKTMELEQVTATKRRDALLSYISHELRTPITSIAGYLEAINKGVLTEPEELRDAMATITSKTEALRSLVSDLDMLSKLEVGRFAFNFMNCSVEELSSAFARNNVYDIASAGYTPVVSGLDSLPASACVIADEDRIGQVFRNLVSNAIKYSLPGTEIRLSFFVSTEHRVWKVSVSDQGPGIDDKEIPYVFDRLYRSKDSRIRKKNGHGLGLSIAREIIEAHKGTISLHNNEGAGCTFVFTLPLYEEE